MEFRDLLIYGLIKYKEDIKADDGLSGEEKQKELDSIEQEVKEFKQDTDEQTKLQEEQKTTEETSQTEVQDAQELTEVLPAAKQIKAQPNNHCTNVMGSTANFHAPWCKFLLAWRSLLNLPG